MISPVCNRCKKELKFFGGLAFSPPLGSRSAVYKYHLCKICWDNFEEWLDIPNKEEDDISYLGTFREWLNFLN